MQAYVLGHKKFHGVQTALVEKKFHDFTDRDKVTFLINRIKCNTLDSVISVVLGGAARADFEAAQLMLAEHVSMLMERSKFRSRNFLATYAARGPRSGRGDRGRGGCGGGGVRGGGGSMLNGE